MNKVITNITIGNWYLVRGKPTKITPANVVWAFRDGCFPVPLTSEILKDNGFRREGAAAYWHDENFCFSMVVLFWNEEKTEQLISKKGEVHPYCLKLEIKYVHQLQDAMRLANISKEIKL